MKIALWMLYLLSIGALCGALLYVLHRRRICWIVVLPLACALLAPLPWTQDAPEWAPAWSVLAAMLRDDVAISLQHLALPLGIVVAGLMLGALIDWLLRSTTAEALPAEAGFEETEFAEEEYAETEFEEAEFAGEEFTETEFEEAEFAGEEFTETEFEETEFAGEEFAETEFEETEFAGEKFAETEFNNAEFEDEEFAQETDHDATDHEVIDQKT